jgi:hypothetical protein
VQDGILWGDVEDEEAVLEDQGGGVLDVRSRVVGLSGALEGSQEPEGDQMLLVKLTGRTGNAILINADLITVIARTGSDGGAVTDIGFDEGNIVCVQETMEEVAKSLADRLGQRWQSFAGG